MLTNAIKVYKRELIYYLPMKTVILKYETAAFPYNCVKVTLFSKILSYARSKIR